MDHDEIIRPWLGIRVVALLGPTTPVKRIANLSDRGMIDHMRAEAGKPRLYSLASAIQVHATHWLTEQKYAASFAAEIGRKVISRFEKVNSEDPDYFGEWCGSADDPAGRIMFFWRNSKGEAEAVCRSPSEIASDLTRSGQFFSPNTQIEMQETRLRPSNAAFGVLDCDGLIHAVVKTYRGIDEDFNKLALEGRLKPFPKELE